MSFSRFSTQQIMMLMDQLEDAFPALSTTHIGSQFIIEGLNYCSNKVDLLSTFDA